MYPKALCASDIVNDLLYEHGYSKRLWAWKT